MAPRRDNPKGRADLWTTRSRLVTVNLGLGFFLPASHADDSRQLFPICKRCAAPGVPVALVNGPTMPDPVFNDADAVIRVAHVFPRLPIIGYHGFYRP
ncbi:hypothetical protein D3260_01195 [Salinisphaera sp. Q1T1-3]|nr:hypothetical protein D3260_01195 [Salinisphaera sp. Q1T1-3]